ncbi:MAG: ATP-binding cassette domain-containing protein [Flavobacteriaceae bacterium]
MLKNHIALYLSNTESKGNIIAQIQEGRLFKDLKTLRGVLFSEISLNRFIKEELTHGRFDVETSTKNSLKNSSEGERKKALLNHIISQNPEYIILDNVFGNLDVKAQTDIENRLEALSNTVLLIQIANRKRDILPFIKTVYEVKNNTLFPFNIKEEENTAKTNFITVLPQPDKPFGNEINPIIKFNNVSVSYGERCILNTINWEIKTGEFWQLIGPNGSGKSTILSMIFGDNPKAFGQDIVLFGTKKGSGESVWDIKQKIGYFSSEMLRGFTRLDSIGNMVVSGFFDTIGLYKTPTSAQIKIAQQWLEVLGMYDIRKKDFLSLSNGHQRLVLIARAMVKHPPLLILDEPTNGLDDHDAHLFCQLINKIAKETQTTILYVSHRKEEYLLEPDFVYQLIPSKTGSVGSEKQQ